MTKNLVYATLLLMFSPLCFAAPPAHPAPLRSQGQIRQGTVNHTISLGRTYCQQVAMAANQRLTAPLCANAITKGLKAAEAVCSGAAFTGVHESTDLESTVVNINYLLSATGALSRSLLVCGSLLSNDLSYTESSVRGFASDFFKINESGGGEFQQLVGQGLTPAEVSAVHNEWLGYSQALHSYFESR